MPKLYETFMVTAEVGKDISVDAITSTEAEKKKLVAVYPDDTLAVSFLLVHLERTKLCDLYIANVAGDVCKRVVFDQEIPTGQKTQVGYRAGAAEDGEKYIVVEYELI